jgi:uncharacterized protein (DUF1697 family)
MATTVALLRAVNLGARNKVPMAELRKLCAELGHAEATTFIASGNVVFPREAPAAVALETAIAERFGVRTTVVLRSAAQLRKLASADPFGSRTRDCFVAFLGAKPARAGFEALSTSDFPQTAWERIDPDLAILYPSGFHRAQLTVARLERLLGVPATLRNWRTVTRLAELAAAA